MRLFLSPEPIRVEMMKWMHRITTDSLFKEPQQVLIARLQTATDYLLSEPMSFKKQAIFMRMEGEQVVEKRKNNNLVSFLGMLVRSIATHMQTTMGKIFSVVIATFAQAISGKHWKHTGNNC